MELPEIEPFVSWEEIEQHPDFLNLDDDNKLTVKTNWFKKEVESSPQWESLPDHKKRVAWHNFLTDTRLPTPAQEALEHKDPVMTASLMVAGGAAQLPKAAIVGGKTLPAFLKGAGEVGLTLKMMEKGYEVGAWAGGKLTNENEWGRLIGGSLVAGLLPVGAYTLARSLVAKEMWPKGGNDNPKMWQRTYNNEINRIKKLLSQPWEKIRLRWGKQGKGPGGKPQPVEPDQPSWDDLMKKYGSVDKMFEAEGGMGNTARKYRAVYDWLNKQRSRGDTGYQSQANARAEREAANGTARKAEEEYWQKRAAENEEVASKINKAAQARRTSGESKPQDRDYALMVVEDVLPVSAKMEKSLSGRQGTKVPIAPHVAKPTPIKEGVKAVKVTPPDAGRYTGHLTMLRDMVDEGRPGERIRTIDYDGTEQWQGFSSTYPDFMKKQGWTRKEVLAAIDKGMKGEKLTPKQQNIYESALEQSKEMFRHDAKEYGRIKKKATEEEKARGISERDLQESLKKEVAEEIARERDYTENERKAIQSESDSFFQEDISFKPEEIEPTGKPLEPKLTEVEKLQTKITALEKEAYDVAKKEATPWSEKFQNRYQLETKRREKQIQAYREQINTIREQQSRDDKTGQLFEFLGMQQLWEGIKTIFTETKPTTQEAGAPVQVIADQVKSLFKRYYGLNPEMKKRFTSIQESKEIVEDEVLEQVFKRGLPGFTKQEATALTWHRSNPTKYPIPKGRNREAEFINQTLEFAMQALNKRELAMRWPDTAINRIQIKIDQLEQEIKVMVSKKAKATRQETVDDLRATIEELRKRRYVPHIAIPSMTRKIMGFIDNVYPGKWKARRGEKLSSQIKRFLGRQTLSLEEFVAATKEKGVEAELDIRVLLADYLNYTMDKCIVYDEVERLKQIPDLILPVEEMPSDWKAIKGVKQLQGYGAHPFLADAIIEFTAEYPTRNLLLKGYDGINRLGKFIVFYNPMIMTVNDISQIYMGGGLTSKEMGKTIMGIAKPHLDTAVRDVMTNSPLMRESQKLGLFSSPWHGRPSMIDMARMWAAHVESTKPEWHKALEKSVGKEIDFEKWINPIIAGKDFYDTAFKVTWTLDRIWRMTQVRNLMEKGMALPDAVERTRKLMVQYDYLPNRTRVFLNRIFLTPTYRVGMLRLYGNLARHPMEKIALPYKGASREEIPFEERMGREAKPEDFSRENMKALGRYALLKFLMYAGAPLVGYTWLESYRMIKRKESGEEEIFTLPGPMFELEKLFGRAWTNSLYLNLARIPYMMVSLKKNKDWKGEKIIDWGAPKHVILGQFSWYITKTYLAPLERFEMLSGDEQDAMGKVLSFLAVSKYTRQSPHSWRGYQIYKANREYIQYINPRKSSGVLDEKRRPSATNQVLAYKKWQKRLEEINRDFERRQEKLSEPFKENLFWKIFSGQPGEV